MPLLDVEVSCGRVVSGSLLHLGRSKTSICRRVFLEISNPKFQCNNTTLFVAREMATAVQAISQDIRNIHIIIGTYNSPLDNNTIDRQGTHAYY